MCPVACVVRQIITAHSRPLSRIFPQRTQSKFLYWQLYNGLPQLFLVQAAKLSQSLRPKSRGVFALLLNSPGGRPVSDFVKIHIQQNRDQIRMQKFASKKVCICATHRSDPSSAVFDQSHTHPPHTHTHTHARAHTHTPQNCFCVQIQTNQFPQPHGNQPQPEQTPDPPLCFQSFWNILHFFRFCF